MNKESLSEFNKELQALLAKYKVKLAVEDVPATKRIAVIPDEPKVEETVDGTK